MSAEPTDHAEHVVYAADPADGGLRLDTFLARRMLWRSRSSIQRLIQNDGVALERGEARRTTRRTALTILPGDRVHVRLPKPRRDLEFGPDGAPLDPDLNLIHEDRWLLALDKPPNVAVHPAGRNLYRTVITALQRRYRDPADPARGFEVKLCHRLDYETSGVLLVAKEERAHRHVMEQFRARTPQKDYLAIVHGVPRERRATIDLPIGPAAASKVTMARAVRYDSAGQSARTGYEVVQALRDFALLRLRLHTGRHHQIRVHCAAIGHPLVGDKLYGGDQDVFLRYYDDELTPEDHESLLLPRQALHAWRLVIQHPATLAPLELLAPLPPDLGAFLRTRGGDPGALPGGEGSAAR